MPILSRIYTRGGDAGQTSLPDGRRVPKNDLHLAVEGEIDELNSVLGWVGAAEFAASELPPQLQIRQRELFLLGASQLKDRHVAELESSIDAMSRELGPLRNFILPAGTEAACRLHIARTVCRRAERALVALSRQESTSPASLAFLNRLSDWLFTAARLENLRAGRAEAPWRREV